MRKLRCSRAEVSRSLSGRQLRADLHICEAHRNIVNLTNHRWQLLQRRGDGAAAERNYEGHQQPTHFAERYRSATRMLGAGCASAQNVTSIGVGCSDWLGAGGFSFIREKMLSENVVTTDRKTRPLLLFKTSRLRSARHGALKHAARKTAERFRFSFDASLLQNASLENATTSRCKAPRNVPLSEKPSCDCIATFPPLEDWNRTFINIA